MKKLLILGGGIGEVPIIARAKELGYYVMVTDSRSYVPGKELADKFFDTNALHTDDVARLIENEHVDGIFATSDALLQSIAKIAHNTGLRWISVDITNLYKNKFMMREYCKNLNIPSVAYKKCTTIDEALAFFVERKKKCIIKPLDGCASRGVFSINTEEELRSFFPLCQNNDGEQSILIEEYIEGTEFTVDSICKDGKNFCLAISEKKHYDYNENVANQLLFSNTSDKYDYDLLRRTNDELVEKSGLNFGITHAEYKYQDGKFYLIEIQARGGGMFISTDIVPFMSGIDGIACMLKWTMGENVQVSYDYGHLSDKCAVLHFFDVPGKCGVVKEIKGLDFFESLGNQIMYHLNFKVGDTIQETKDDSTRIGWYILKSPSRKALDETMAKIESTFRIII